MPTATTLPPPARAATEPDPPSSRLARNAAALFLGGAGAGGVKAVRSVVLSRLLGPPAYGLLELALFLSRTVASLSRLGLADATVRFGAAMNARDARAFARRAAVVVGIASAIAAPTAALLSLGYLARAGPAAGLVAALAFGAIPPIAVAEIAKASFHARQDFATPATIGFATTVAAFALEVLAVALGLGVPGVLGASAIASAGALAAFGLASRREGPGRAPRRGGGLPRSEVGRYAATRLVLAAFTIVTWTRFEVVFLGASWNAAEVAFYAVPFGIVTAVFELIPGSISAVLPASYPERRARGGDAAANALYSRALFQMAALGLPLAAIGAVLAEPLVRLAFSERYLASVPVVRILAAGSVLAMIASAASHLLLSSRRATWMLALAGAGAAVNLGLDLAWIPAGGAVGAAWANATAQVFESALVVTAAGVLFRAAPPARRLARLALPLAASIAVGLGGLRIAGAQPLAAVLLAPVMAATYALLARACGAFSAADAEGFVALVPPVFRRRRPAVARPPR